jgi:general secretion pathway protein A
MAAYDAFYGFRQSPFAVSPDPRFLWLSPQHREALTGMMYAVADRKGFVVLTGEVGTGKTTLVHALLSELRARAKTAVVFNPTLTHADLYQELLSEFQLPPQSTVAASVRVLQAFLLRQFHHGTPVVVILDEAHMLTHEVLEGVRLLSNFETPQAKLLLVLLVGQTELADRLQQPALRQLRQRVSLWLQLSALSFPELITYVRARLAVAGRDDEIFTRHAYPAVYRFTGGLPRLINTLCDNAMLVALARDRERVGRGIVRRAAQRLALPAIARVGLWQRLRAAMRPPEEVYSLGTVTEVGLGSTGAGE